MIVCRMILLICITAFMSGRINIAEESSLRGKKICIDPGHGGTAATDSYRVGLNGEREEWINLRVALLLKKILEEKGAIVFMTRTADVTIDLASRAEMAKENKADAFISIHHNATADRKVNFPIVYYHGAASENEAGVLLGVHLANALTKIMYGDERTRVTVVSDYTIFPERGAAVLRNSYGIPGLLAEASFFTNPEEEQRLTNPEHNRKEAEAFASALELFFETKVPPIKEKQIPNQLPPFEVLQEADRMKPEALLWLEDYSTATELFKKRNNESMREAYDLFTRSAKSFPDSWVARECHEYRAAILNYQNKKREAAEELTRAKEFYIKF